MTITTSSQFASIIETGTDWRDTAKKVLEQLESVRTDNDGFNFGFLYVSDHLAGDLSSILNLFKSVLNIENWVGSIGMGVCGNGIEYIDKPAISVMIGHFDEDQFCFFSTGMHNDENDFSKSCEDWLKHHDPMLVLSHGDPMMQDNPNHLLKNIDMDIGGFCVGGLASSRTQHGVVIKNPHTDVLGGVIFSDSVKVATSISQGCVPTSDIHTITKCHDNSAITINDKPALDIFEDDLRAMTIKKSDIDPNDPKISNDLLNNPEKLPDEIKNLFKGEMHVAFPVSGSDQGDYLVRNIIGIDEDERSIDIAHMLVTGERMMFVHRDDESVRADLSQTLLQLRQRVIKDNDDFTPKGAVYISCVARAFNNFGQDEECGEMALVKEVIGDIPLTGFYASGEISSGRLYGYTGILILFL